VHRHDLDGAVRFERHRARDHLERHRAERIDVGGRIDLRALCLFGRQVQRRSHHDTGPCPVVSTALLPAGQLREAEVEQFHLRLLVLARLEIDVVGLEVAVHDTRLVRRLQCLRDRLEHLECLGKLQRLLQAITQRLALEPLHDKEAPTVGKLAEAEHVDDVRVTDLIHRLRLEHEAIDGLGISRQLAANDFDRGPLADQRMARAVHAAHAALADLLLDPVFAREAARREIVCGRRERGSRRPVGWIRGLRGRAQHRAVLGARREMIRPHLPARGAPRHRTNCSPALG